MITPLNACILLTNTDTKIHYGTFKKMNLKRAMWSQSTELWRQFSWPFRPSPQNIYKASKLIKPDFSVLILGSTPEYRILSSNMGLNTDIIDVSPDIYRDMSDLFNSDTKHERLIIGKWEDTICDLKNIYDLILGHQINDNIEFNNWDSVFASISNSLSFYGSFLFTTFCFDFTSSESPQSYVKRLALEREMSYANRSYYLLSILNNPSFFERDGNYIQLHKVSHQIKSELENVGIKADVRNALTIGEYNWAATHRDTQDGMLKAHFEKCRFTTEDLHRSQEFIRIYELSNGVTA